MKTQVVPVRRADGSWIDVQAEVYGPFAIHASRGAEQLTSVVHRRSGLLVLWTQSPAGAWRAVRRLCQARLDWDFDSPDTAPFTTCDRARAIARDAWRDDHAGLTGARGRW